jgi:hypothetical protein
MARSSGIARHFRAVLGLVVAASAFSATSVQAGTFYYPDIQGAGFTVTNIRENNSSNVPLYGQPDIVGGKLDFPNVTSDFSVATANVGFKQLSGILRFTVTFINPPTNAPDITVNEHGSFNGLGDASAWVSPHIWLTDASANILGSAVDTITSSPFGPTPQGFNWTGSVNAANGAPVTTFNVELENDLFVMSNAPGAFAEADKKGVTIDICPDCSGSTPEPASLGIVALGGLALLARRRK